MSLSRLADAAYCAAVVRHNAHTFHRASRVLPGSKRRATFAVYAFCRTADDVADDGGLPPRVVREELDRLRAGLEAAVAGHPTGPLFRELAWAVSRYGLPVAPLRALLDTVAGDLAPASYDSWARLREYCAGVASTVGEVCAHVFGLPDEHEARALAVRHARTLGVAMQLTNILRDVGEDALMDRCYLPRDELTRFGLTVDDILHRRVAARDPRWRALMVHEIGRARALYAESLPGVLLLAPDAQRCAMMCAHGYRRILEAIERIDYDCLARRAHVGLRARTAVMLEVWRSTPAPGLARATA